MVLEEIHAEYQENVRCSNLFLFINTSSLVSRLIVYVIANPCEKCKELSYPNCSKEFVNGRGPCGGHTFRVHVFLSRWKETFALHVKGNFCLEFPPPPYASTPYHGVQTLSLILASPLESSPSLRQRGRYAEWADDANVSSSVNSQLSGIRSLPPSTVIACQEVVDVHNWAVILHSKRFCGRIGWLYAVIDWDGAFVITPLRKWHKWF